MSSVFKLLCMTFHIAMYLACESLSYTFEYELLKRQFNCNTLCRRAFNECNECVFTFPVLSLSQVSHFFRYQTRVSQRYLTMELTLLEFTDRLCKCKLFWQKMFFKDLSMFFKTNNGVTHDVNYFSPELKS